MKKGTVFRTVFIMLAALAASLTIVQANANEAPKSIDPFEDLIDVKQLQSTDKLFFNPLQGKRVGVIVSKNAEAQMGWIRDKVKPKGVSALFISAFGMSDQMRRLGEKFTDTNDMKEALLLPFVVRADETKVFSDLQSFLDSGFDVAVIFDINWHYSISGFFTREQQFGLRLDAYLLDKDLRLGPSINGQSFEKTEAEGAATWEYAFRSKSVAIDNFQKNAASMLGPLRSSTGDQAPTVEQRLQQLESLRSRGLITNDELIQRRQKILDSL